MLCDYYNESLEYQENLLTKYYLKNNHQVTIITSTYESVFDYYAGSHDKKAPQRVYFDKGAKIIRLRYCFNILNKIRRYTSIKGILENEEPDLIFIHDIMPNIIEAVKYIKKKPNCKMIMDYHADYSNSGKNWLSINILHKIIRKKIYLDRARKYISKIFPVVPASKIFLHEVYNIPFEDMQLLPLGADTDLGAELNRKGWGLAIRNRYNIEEKDFVIFTGGKLEPIKKTELLIEAFFKINNEKVHLFIIGKASREHNAYMDYLINISYGNSRIHFVGWLESVEVYKYLDASEIAVFPASQSILWQQAISMGLPLIVGDKGHQSIAYLNRFDNIIILEKKRITSEVIAEVITKLINDEALLNIMKMGAKKTTEEYLNWDKLILKTLSYN